MTVFRYDKTFEGLLTAVFDAYSRKEFPERLLSPAEPLPLFTAREHSVHTEAGKSARVWNALDKKLPDGVCGMLLCVWLSELPGSDEALFRYIRKSLDAARPIAGNLADDDVALVEKTAGKVNRERLQLIQFVRFQKTADNVFFAPVAPLYNSLPLTLAHFTGRFAGQRWLIYDIKRRYGYYYDLKTAAEVTLDDDTKLISGRLDGELLAADEKLFQDMWKSYFRAITLKERLNPALQRSHMPRRYWKFMPEMD
jgi:probable DNA metabolism protein